MLIASHLCEQKMRNMCTNFSQPVNYIPELTLNRACSEFATKRGSLVALFPQLGSHTSVANPAVYKGGDFFSLPPFGYNALFHGSLKAPNWPHGLCDWFIEAVPQDCAIGL